MPNGLPGIRKVEIGTNPGNGKRYVDDFLVGETGKVGAGGNSGFQALNLAVQWGARRIILIGFDMTDQSGVHWYGRNNWPRANNPDHNNFKRWIEAFTKAAPQLQRMGVEVFNCSPASALKCFPQASIEEALRIEGTGSNQQDCRR